MCRSNPAFVSLLFSAALLAQTTPGTGSLHGVVIDASGSAVPGASVQLADIERGFTRETFSNDAGLFVFANIPAGTYRGHIQKAGFESVEVTGVRLNVGQTGAIEVLLKPGEVKSVITVSAEQQLLLETESNLIGRVVDREEVQSLPLNGRNFLQLGLLAGGVNEPVGRSSMISNQIGYPDRGIVLAGNLSYMSGYLINGVSTRGSRLGESAVNLSLAAIDQFKLQESFFLPDQGPNPGLVNLVTRSGGNQFHGQAFYFLRNTALDARNFFATKAEDLHRNQFGLSGGGPIKRDRAWVFGHYEGLREITNLAATAYTPTRRMFEGDLRELGQPVFDPDTFSATSGRQPFPGNVIPPHRINPVSRNLLRYYTPGSSLAERPVNVWGYSRSDVTEHQGGIRADAALTPNQTLFGQFIETRASAVRGGVFPLSGTFFPNDSRFAMLQHTWAASPAAVFTTRLAFVRNRAFRGNEARDMGPILSDIGVMNTMDNRGITSITLQSFTGFGQATGDVGNADNNYQLDVGVHYLRGTHTLQAGTGIRYHRTWQQNANGAAHGGLFFQPNYTAQVESDGAGGFRPIAGTGSDFADFLLGVPTLGQMSGLPVLAYRYSQFMPYFQDTWRVRQGLTINYGIGWFLETVPDPRGRARDWAHGFDPSTGLLTYAALGEVDPRIVRRDNNNVTPRLGIAWAPSFLPKTVIRTGAGIYYSDTALFWLLNATLAPPFSAPVIVAVDPLNPVPAYRFGQNLFPAIPNPPLDDSYAASLPPGTSARVLDPDLRTPLVQQWNFSVTHSMTAELFAEIVYTGASSHRLTNTLDLAQCVADPDNRCRPETRPYPRYSSLIAIEANGNSSYHAGIARLGYRSRSGLTLRAEYTFAKALTDTAEIAGILEHQIATCRRCEKALTAFDQRHRLTVSAIAPIPAGRGQRLAARWPGWAQTIVSGWQVNVLATFSTGPPIDQIAPNTTASALIFHRPNRICDGRDDSLASNLRNNGFQYYNPACFVPAPLGFFGNAGRNIMGSPGINNWDIGVNKYLPLIEGTRLEFRAEFFNAWNHTQFGSPNRFLGPNLGRVSTARAPRLIQLGMLLHW
jgi:hypothetical protein